MTTAPHHLRRAKTCGKPYFHTIQNVRDSESSLTRRRVDRECNAWVVWSQLECKVQKFRLLASTNRTCHRHSGDENDWHQVSNQNCNPAILLCHTQDCPGLLIMDLRSKLKASFRFRNIWSSALAESLDANPDNFQGPFSPTDGTVWPTFDLHYRRSSPESLYKMYSGQVAHVPHV